MADRNIGDPGVATADAESMIAEIDRWYRAYMEAMSRRDLDHIVDEVVATPYAEISIDGEMVVRASEDQLREQYRAAFEQFRESGWSETVIDDLQIWPLSDNSAMLIPTLTRYAEDGSVLMRAKRVVYLLRRTSQGWRVASYAYVSDGFQVPAGPDR